MSTLQQNDLIPALVTAVHKERYELLCENKLVYGKLKTSSYQGGFELYPTTGDSVLIKYNDMGDSIIHSTQERKSFFSRLEPGKMRPTEQAVAANFDYVFIMASLNYDFNIRRIERYLTLAWQSGAVPVIILTKSDLTDGCDEQMRALDNIAMGVDIHAVSALTRQGLDALGKYLLPGNVIVFLGSSGVGKSSLLNALAGGDVMTVNTIREDDSKGRHTTTHRQLITLPCGAMIIDTPGMRVLGMWDAESGLGGAFADVEAYFGRCRFSDCTHRNEPGCAVTEAIADGSLPRARLESYLKLKRETAYVDNKAEFIRKKTEQYKSISKWNRLNKKNKP